MLRNIGPHYVIWGCATSLHITPSVGRNLTLWDYAASEVLLTRRAAPYWDTGFVESAMPPLKLSTGDLLFFYDSVGYWAAGDGNGFQAGWAVLSGSDPTHVLARAEEPPLPFTLPWQQGVAPFACNVPNVTNWGGGHAIAGRKDDAFRVYYGGADAVVGSAVVTVSVDEA